MSKTKFSALTRAAVAQSNARKEEVTALARFSLDPESGFVHDGRTGEWLTTAAEVFDAFWEVLSDNPRTGIHIEEKPQWPSDSAV